MLTMFLLTATSLFPVSEVIVEERAPAVVVEEPAVECRVYPHHHYHHDDVIVEEEVKVK